ncbi:MAG TPA: ATP-binding protein [Anaerolineae bacterium]|nr:ATP-binding protein [Anaerolineae bacterium]
MNSFKQFLAPPHFDDPEQARMASLLNRILVVLGGATILITTCLIFFDPSSIWIGILALISIFVGKYVLNYIGITPASWLFLLSFSALIITTEAQEAGIRSAGATAHYLLIMLAGALLGVQGTTVFGTIAFIATIGLYLAEINGIIISAYTPIINFVAFIIYLIVLFLVTALQRFIAATVAQGFAQAREKEAILQAKNQQLAEKETTLQAQNQQLAEEVDLRRETEQQLRKTNERLDQFAYMVSHDLKAPLRGITNLAMWIEEDMEGNIPAEVKEHLTHMQERTTHMRQLINGILEYSRIDQQSSELTEVDVTQLLTEIIDLLTAPQGFKFEIIPPMYTFTTHQIQLEQVLLNLLSNAVKYHHEPMKGLTQISIKEQENFYQFTVADNGPGIAPEHHEKIFGMFETLGAKNSNVDSTGVGLAVVKKIVEEQGGSIWIESDKGQGAKFQFTWPKNSST